MTHIELRTKVGPDGMLTLNVPVGMAEANRDVKVVVESVAPEAVRAPAMSREEWQTFIAGTAGAWLGDLERPEQGAYETRDAWP